MVAWLGMVTMLGMFIFTCRPMYVCIVYSLYLACLILVKIACMLASYKMFFLPSFWCGIGGA